MCVFHFRVDVLRGFFREDRRLAGADEERRFNIHLYQRYSNCASRHAGTSWGLAKETASRNRKPKLM